MQELTLGFSGMKLGPEPLGPEGFPSAFWSHSKSSLGSCGNCIWRLYWNGGNQHGSPYIMVQMIMRASIIVQTFTIPGSVLHEDQLRHKLRVFAEGAGPGSKG